MITPEQEKIILEVTSRFNPVLLGVFGSFARNEQNQKSDLDLLIDFDTKINLLDLVGLEQELSEILGIKVDVVTLNSVNQRLVPYIQKELVRII